MADSRSSSSGGPRAPQREFPEAVGRYRIIRRLGEGGMGSVFLAQDTILRREVALKLPLTGTENDPEVRERFLREARSAATLDHPYICRVYDADEVDGRLYLAMAYIEGQSLADLVRAEGMPPRQVVALVGKLAIALQEAHSHGVVHRDLKPRNVMIRTAGSKREPVIVDFGLARLDGPEDVRMTKTGQVMGTPAYMAPEQLLGKPDEVGPACDIYALGVILYELLTGRLPFVGSPAVVMAQILTQPPLPPSAHTPGLHPALDAICLKAMAKEPAARYRSMIDLASALTEHLRVVPTVSTSGRPVAPISRPIEGDSIPTGADTLVSQLLGRQVDEVDSQKSRIKRDPSSTEDKSPATPLSGSTEDSELGPAEPRSRQRSARELGIWALVAAVLLIAVILLFRRDRPEVDGAPSTLERPESPVINNQSTANGPARKVNKAAPTITTRRPNAELARHSNLLSHPARTRIRCRRLLLSIAINLGRCSTAQDLTDLDESARLALGSWKVEGGVIHGSGRGSHLFSPRGDYKNFKFRAVVKISDKGNSGVYFRTKKGPGFPNGYEAQINSTDRDPVKTGSLYNQAMIRNPRPPAPGFRDPRQQVTISSSRSTARPRSTTSCARTPTRARTSRFPAPAPPDPQGQDRDREILDLPD